jgi:hypothetical protein
MEEKDLIYKLEKARLPEFTVSAAQAEAKKALFAAPQKKRPQSYLKLVTAMAGMFALAVATYYVIDTMDEGNRFNRNGGVWSTYCDAQEGGNSEIWPPAGTASANEFEMSQPGFGETGYAVMIKGKTGQKMGFNYNYLGVVNRFSSASACPACQGSNIRKYTGIMFKVKGRITSGNLTFVIPYESNECVPDRLTCKSLTGYADFERDITAEVGDRWQTVVIDFRKDLAQPYWTPGSAKSDIEKVLENIHLFKWQYKNGTGEEMELWIDDVQLY